MYEVDFTGWTRTPEEIARCKKFWYRWNRHRIRIVKAIEFGRLDWDMVKAFLINRKLDFE